MTKVFARLFPHRGPLPEVQESSWADWEDSVAADLLVEESAARALHPVPEPTDVAWDVWERASQGVE
jgi:hypothetical protein